MGFRVEGVQSFLGAVEGFGPSFDRVVGFQWVPQWVPCKGLSYRGYDRGLSRSSGFKNYKANTVQNSLNVIDTIYLHC